MINRLSEVKDTYKVTDKVNGEISYGPKKPGTGKSGNAFLCLDAAGKAIETLTEPHITIWGATPMIDSKIDTVEFSWSGAKHIRYAAKWKTFSSPDLATKDQPDAAKNELLLKLFLNEAQIANIVIPPSETKPEPAAQTSVAVQGTPEYDSQFPAFPLGAPFKKGKF